MSASLTNNPLREEFINGDEEYRYAYAEDFLNTYIATQIKVLRDKRGMKQEDLAQAIGTKQSGISRLENVNYSAWKTETLRKIARALGVRLKISFETFGTLLDEDASFNRRALERPSFEEDPAFQDKPIKDAEPVPDLEEVFAVFEDIGQKTNAVEIKNYLEGQKTNVVEIKSYLEGRAQSQRGNKLYETLVGSTGSNRRTLTS